MAGAIENHVERITLEVDRYEAHDPFWRRQLIDTFSLVALCCRMIDFEDLYAGELREAPSAAVVPGAEDDELPRAAGNRFTYGAVDGRRTKRDEVGHHASRLHAYALLPTLRGVLDLRK